LIGPEFIHLPSKAMWAFQKMEDLNNYSMEVVWDCCFNSMMNGYKPVNLEEGPEYSDPFERSQHWRNGNIDDELQVIRDECSNRTWQQSVDLVVTDSSIGDPYKDIEDYLARSWALARDRERNGLYQPVSFMSKDSFEWLIKNGRVKLRDDFTEESLMRFSDDPFYANEVAMSRLWGEDFKELTTAFYVNIDDDEQISTLSKMCGQVKVYWKREVLGYSTLSLNDSQLSQFCLPASRDNREKYMAVLAASQVGTMTANNPGFIPALASRVAGNPCWVNYVELQVHEALTMKHISSVDDG